MGNHRSIGRDSGGEGGRWFGYGHPHHEHDERVAYKRTVHGGRGREMFPFHEGMAEQDGKNAHGHRTGRDRDRGVGMGSLLSFPPYITGKRLMFSHQILVLCESRILIYWEATDSQLSRLVSFHPLRIDTHIAMCLRNTASSKVYCPKRGKRSDGTISVAQSTVWMTTPQRNLFTLQRCFT